MAPDAPSGTRPAPVVLRIKLRYDDVEALVQRFAANVGRSGLFLPTRSLQAVGAEVKFELRLADDKPVLVGLGRVKAAKAPDPEHPRAAFGMAIELMRVTRESRDVILKMLERRKAIGLPEVGIPMPADIDAARRGEVVDTSVKDATATAVPEAATTIDSAPILTTPRASPDSVPVLTAPRRISGPLAVAKVQAFAPLQPELPRKQRAAVHDVIERASGPVAALPVTVPGLDDDVDVGAVLARARALAGDGLDAELEALRDGFAAPIEISVEAASAELAKQLGGAAITRDRSARWAPPPSTVSAPGDDPADDAAAVPPEAPADAAVAEAVVEAPAEAAAVEAAVEAPAVEAPMEAAVEAPVEAPVEAAPAEAAPIEAAPEAVMVDREPSAPMIARDAAPEPDDDDEPSEEVSPEQIADEIHQLSDADFEEVEHTAIGGMPEAPRGDDAPIGFEQHAFATEPAATLDLERSIDQHLAEAEEDDLELAAQLAATPAVAVPLGSGDLEIPSDDELARLDDAAPAAAYEEPPLEDEPIEEIDDFEILAEADAADEDLLTSDGEADASGGHDPAPLAEPPENEFASEYQVALAAPAYELAAEAAFAEPAPAPAHVEAPYSLPPEPYVEPEGAYAEPEAPYSLPPEEEPSSAYRAPEPAYEAPPGPSYPRARAPARPADEPPPRLSESDFVARLDLSDQFEAVPEHDAYGRGESLSELDAALGGLDPDAVSAGHALAAFDDEEPDGDPRYREPPEPGDLDADSQYTVAGDLPQPSIDFEPPSTPGRVRRAPQETPPAGFPPLHSFDASDVIQAQPHPERGAAADGYDLETALEALDVDLDDLSVPHAPTELAAATPRSVPRAPSGLPSSRQFPRPGSALPPSQPRPRAQRHVAPKRGKPTRVETDIPIDFDDFEDE